MNIRKFTTLLIGCLVLASMLMVVHAPGSARPTSVSPTSLASNWSIECVDCPKSFLYFSDRGLQIDVNGHSHITYGGDHLYYAWYDGVQWNNETVDTARGTGEYASLALDANNYPHISYYDSVCGDLKYAYKDNVGWNILTVDSQDNVGARPSLALDISGHPHISYYDITNQDLKYAHYDGSAWTTETVDSVGDVGSFSSIAMDSSDYPHISYYDATSLQPKYAYWTGDSWNIQLINSTYSGQYISLALDSSDLPHISFGFHYVSFYSVKYAHWDGSSWDIQELDPEDNSWGFTSITVDSSDHPHIATLATWNRVKYAVWNGSSWDIQVLDGSGDVYESISLALDNTGVPRIAYRTERWGNNAEHSLKHASWSGSAWDFETIDDASETAGPTSLSLDELGNPQVAYMSGVFVMGMPTANLSHARRDGSTWQTETVDGSGGVGWRLSMDVEPNGTPHIAYFDDLLNVYRYAFWNGSSWDIQTVGPGNGYVSLVLDSSGYPHLAYFAGDLYHVYWNGSTWVFQLVDDSGGSNGGVSLSFDSQGYAHISYCVNNSIKYAFWDGDEWNVQTVESNIGYDSQTSLALDSLGNPHISYYFGYPSGILKYATWTGGPWDIQEVDSNSDVGNGNSIAVDSLDQPHISYNDFTNGDLKYAFWNGSDWFIQTIADVGYSSGLTSLKLDIADNPYISYFDWTTRDIMLAHLSGEPVAPSNVVLSGPDSGDVQTSLTFTATIDPISTTLPIEYLWEATEQSPITHTGGLLNTVSFAWDTPGTQVITVTATNAFGEVSDSHEITLSDVPITGLNAVNDSPTTLGEITALSATVSTGTNINYAWDFGDGASAVGAMVTHIYPDIGLYTVTVTATNSVDSEATFTLVIITDVPISGLTADNDSPTILGQTTVFTATVSVGTNITFTWDFGDGTSGDGAIVTHIYPNSGLYTATVTASNGVGNLSDTTPVTILAITLPKHIFLPFITKR